MRFMILGVGINYYGRKNEKKHPGVCMICQNFTGFKSYNTLQYFAILFLPIIPLGEKQVLDDCPICGIHKVISKKKWEKQKTENINTAYEKWNKDPDDIETVNELLNAILYFRDEDELNSISNDIYSRYSENAVVMNNLGVIYTHLNQFSKAEEAYRKSLQVEDDNEVRENLAEVLMNTSKPDDARQLIWHIVKEKNMEKMYYIYHLIESYQYIGEHKKALRFIEDCENEMPELKTDKELKYYRRSCESNYDKNRIVKGRLMIFVNTLKSINIKSYIIPKLVSSLFLMILLTIYLFISYNIGTSREVYLVNGLDRNYAVEINDKEYILSALSKKLVKLPEGTLNVEIMDLDVPEDSFEIEINTPFWSRAFNKPIFIINPDSVAVLQKNLKKYKTNKTREHFEAEYKYYTGKRFYEFNNIDFPFIALPNAIKFTNNNKTENKYNLTQINDTIKKDYNALIQFLNEIEQDEAISYIENQLYFNPNDYFLINIYRNYISYENYIKFCKSKLSERPVLVNLHVAYQNQIEGHKPLYNLEGEYATYLKEDKYNNDLRYLLSRTVDDINREKGLLEMSIEGEYPCAYGYYEMAFLNICAGNFEEAVLYSEKAIDYNPDFFQFKWIYKESLFANEEYDKLLSKNEFKQRWSAQDVELVAEELYYHMAKGDIKSANEAIKAYISRNYSFNEQSKNKLKRFLNGIIGYCTYDNSKYISGIEGIQSPVLDYEVAFLNKDYNEAEKITIENYLDKSNFLLLYLSETDKEKANGYLNTAEIAYAQGNKTERLVYKYISGIREWGIEEVKALRIRPCFKRIVVLALAKTKPELKEELFDLIDKLNYDLRFPHNTIEKIIESGEI